MSSHHSEQMSQRSQVSRIALRRCSQNVFVFVFVFVIVIVFVLKRAVKLISIVIATFAGSLLVFAFAFVFVILSVFT